MKAAYTVPELARITRITERSIQRRATRERWFHTWKLGKGGQAMLFPSRTLPGDILDLIHADILLPATRPELPAAPITAAQSSKAMAKADLLRLYLQTLATAPWGKQGAARDQFMVAYNSGLAWPALHATLGALPSWKTLEGWKNRLQKNKGDTFLLADRRGYARKGATGLTEEQTTILLRCALHPNKPRVAEAIRTAHAVMHSKGISNGHSAATYRRWLANWASRNHHIWVFNREGAKAWNDKCAFYIERDHNLLNVGDVIVADGHNLNFEIINPWTGKVQNHMTLILFYDMRSNMPLGWEIMPTENTQAISSALRRAIIRLGKLPQVCYLDNGRAFKSRFFSGSNSFDEAGFAGLYERLGIKTIHAWPYHGQSKTIERFFGTFAELERLNAISYTGTSIENKPPRMMRGEKLHRKVHAKAFGERCLTLTEAHQLIAAWFDEYASRPQRGSLAGDCPRDVFLEGRGLGVDRAALNYLMMSIEIKHIHRNGITFQGQNYYTPALYGRRHQVTVRYDLQDTSSLYVFDADGEFIGEATPVQKLHPAAAHLGTEADRQALIEHIEHKKHQEKEAGASAREFLNAEIMPEHQRRMATLGVGNAAAPQLPAPVKVISLDAEKLAREVAAQGVEQLAADERDFRAELLNMNNSDRYEHLLELEAQGVELGEEWLGFMAFFAKTGDYLEHADYWESRRLAFALMYRQPVEQ